MNETSNIPPADRVMTVIAGALVAVAMSLAAILTIVGVTGQMMHEPSPVPVPAAPDVIYPPAQHGDGSMLRTPCDPVFQRCGAAS